jgi:hypothetical protein
MATPLLPDALWNLIEPLLPGRPVEFYLLVVWFVVAALKVPQPIFVIENDLGYSVDVVAEPSQLLVSPAQFFLCVLVHRSEQFDAVRQGFESFVNVHVVTLYAPAAHVKDYISYRFNSIRARRALNPFARAKFAPT